MNDNLRAAEAYHLYYSDYELTQRGVSALLSVSESRGGQLIRQHWMDRHRASEDAWHEAHRSVYLAEVQNRWTPREREQFLAIDWTTTKPAP